jgi:hypothetical protein
VWRGRGEDDEEEEVKDNITARKPYKTATTGPFAIPGYEQYMKRPTIAPPTTPAVPQKPAVKPVTPGMPAPTTPTTPGRPVTPGMQPAPTPGAPAPAK